MDYNEPYLKGDIVSENENTEKNTNEDYETLVGGLIVGGVIGFFVGCMFVLSIIGLVSIFA